jgi:hypothetical protein
VGQMTWAVHFSLASTFFDPAETPGIITPSSSRRGDHRSPDAERSRV